jgi:hypothetical protein
MAEHGGGSSGSVVVREIFAKLGLDVNAQSLLKAMTVFELAKDAIHKLKENFEGAIEKVKETIEKTAEHAEELEHMSLKTGIGTEALQEFGYAAQMSGSSLGAMTGTLKFLSRNAYEAATKGGAAAAAFQSIGVHVKDAGGKIKEPKELFLAMADAISKVEDPSKRAAMAQRLFGRSGTELLPMLMKGRAGIEALGNEAHEFGVVMDEDTIKSGAELAESLKRISMMSQGLVTLLVGPLMKPLAELAEQFIEWRKANEAVVKTRIAQYTELITKVIHGLADAVKFVVHWLDVFAMILGAIALAMVLSNIPALALLAGAYIRAGIAAAVSGLQAAASWVAAMAPVAALAALLLVIALIADDIYTFLKGGDSMIGRLAPAWEKFAKSWYTNSEGDGWLLTALKAILWFLTERIPEALSDLVDFADGLFKRIFSKKKEAPTGPSLVRGGSRDGIVVPPPDVLTAPVGATGFLNTLSGIGVGAKANYTPIAGGGASPDATALASKAGGGPKVISKIEVPITIHGGGQDPHAIAAAVVPMVDKRIQAHLQEAAAATE